MRASAERKRVSRTAELDIVDAFVAQGRTLTRDPEKWVPVFGKDHAQSKNLERDDDARRNHPAPGRMSCKTNAKHDNAARTCERARRSSAARPSLTGVLMTKAVLGIIGGSGIYDLPGLAKARQKKVKSPWGEPSAPLRMGEIAGTEVVFLSR